MMRWDSFSSSLDMSKICVCLMKRALLTYSSAVGVREAIVKTVLIGTRRNFSVKISKNSSCLAFRPSRKHFTSNARAATTTMSRVSMHATSALQLPQRSMPDTRPSWRNETWLQLRHRLQRSPPCLKLRPRASPTPRLLTIVPASAPLVSEEET